MEPTQTKKAVKVPPKKKVVAVATVDDKEKLGVAIQKGGDLTREQVDLIKENFAKGASDNELKLFLQVCKNSNLNPFLKQVHLVPRWDSKIGREVRTIQVGIDGFRAIAEEGGKYAGSDDAIFRDEGELAVGATKIKIPGSATVAVYKLMANGERYPFTATARWSEYYPGDKQGYMWRKMPYGQLGKCAEALALRKAFPKLLSGFYTPEEMEQAGQKEEGEETKPDDLFLKATEMIKAVKDPAGLVDFKEKIKTSTKYDEKQKTDLIKAIDDRIAELKTITVEPIN